MIYKNINKTYKDNYLCWKSVRCVVHNENSGHLDCDMIATFFLIFAFLRSIRWTRRRAPLNDEQQKSLIESKDKLSSLGHSIFSRSDSSATNTSSSGGTFVGKRRGDSTASTISTSVFSEQMQADGRRSSEGTKLQQNQQPRRSSGRIRRFAGSRTTIAGARRRTTGRFEQFFSHVFFLWMIGAIGGSISK